MVSSLSFFVNDQLCYLRSLGSEAASIGESDKNKRILSLKEELHLNLCIYGSPDSFVGASVFTAALQADCCCYCL